MERRIISQRKWRKQAKHIEINKRDMNALIMNFLIVEGYQDIASTFQKESGASCPVPLDSIRSRMDIRKAIEAGDIARAITHVNELDPHILQNNPELFCHLLQLQLIELIKTGCTREALAFAQHTLAPYASTSGRFLGEMEKIMSLLAFSATGVQASPVGYLLHPIQRTRMANALNEAILKSQCSSSETKLSFVLKRLLWEQRELCKHVDFPHIKRKDFHHAPSVLLASSPPTSSPAAPKSKKHRCKYRR